MRNAIVIPARYDSKRFPGKPLANILGKSLLERTWRIACDVKGVDTVIIATDDERILEHATVVGADVQMTDSKWRNGSERILEALKLKNISPDIVINLQGDAVLTPPFVIEALLRAFSADKNGQYAVATPCVQLTKKHYVQMFKMKSQGITTGTLVTFDQDGKALYFSRSIIPLLRDDNCADNELVPVYRHIGLYAYRLLALKEYVNLAPTPLELAEGLEQLRVIENGMAMKVVPVDYQGRTHGSVDHPEDIVTVENIIKKEGELVKLTADA
jgi:3-deoxy-manno-octulosonate cytidylyltransferase (CMP-KDO synthetase)